MRGFVFTVVGLILALGAPASAKDDPAKRTDALIKTFMTVKKAEEGAALSDADKAANKQAFAKLDDFYDWPTLVASPIEIHKSKLSAAQLERYRELFRQLIRLVAYPSSGNFLRSAKIEIGTAKAAGKTMSVPVALDVTKEDLQMKVDFIWAEKGGQWLLVDAAFDGASLIKDYENQFGRIIGKDGADGFMKKLEQRYEKEMKAAVVAP